MEIETRIMGKRKKRKIAVLTGKRGGFGAMITLMQEIESDLDMQLELIVTDMHLSPLFGSTVKEIKKWFKNPHHVDLEQKGDSGIERGQALGRCVVKMTKILSKIHPDILVLLGDRGEVLSSAIAATELNIPIAHILGGDVAGNRDGNRIHAITKLAHLHFPSSDDSYTRILKLGEEPWRVFKFGATYIDLIVAKKFTANNRAREKYHIGPDEPYIICIQHPMTLQENNSYTEAKALYTALKQTGMKTLIIYPCSDQGYKGVLKALREASKVPQFSIHKNIDSDDFLGLMSGTSLFIGNSSGGLMETPYFDLPTINVGLRQRGRVRDTNVI